MLPNVWEAQAENTSQNCPTDCRMEKWGIYPISCPSMMSCHLPHFWAASAMVCKLQRKSWDSKETLMVLVQKLGNVWETVQPLGCWNQIGRGYVELHHTLHLPVMTRAWQWRYTEFEDMWYICQESSASDTKRWKRGIWKIILNFMGHFYL